MGDTSRMQRVGRGNFSERGLSNHFQHQDLTRRLHIQPPRKAMFLPDASELVKDLFTEWANGPFRYDTSCIHEMHDMSAIALTMTPRLQRHETPLIISVHFFTNGSGGSSEDSDQQAVPLWAVVRLFTLSGRTYRFGGFMCDKIVLGSPEQVGMGVQSYKCPENFVPMRTCVIHVIAKCIDLFPGSTRLPFTFVKYGWQRRAVAARFAQAFAYFSTCELWVTVLTSVSTRCAEMSLARWLKGASYGHSPTPMYGRSYSGTFFGCNMRSAFAFRTHAYICYTTDCKMYRLVSWFNKASLYLCKIQVAAPSNCSALRTRIRLLLYM